MTKLQQEREHAKDLLLNQYKVQPGETIYTKALHVSRSGMMRVVDVYIMRDNQPLRISHSVAQLVHSYNRKHEGVEVGGCGMDVGFEVVYNLGHALFGDGFMCTGTGCPSNDHSNGDRDFTPHLHTSGGYALRQRWM